MSFIRSRSTDSNISSTSENSNSESGYSSNSSNPFGNNISSQNKPIQIDKNIYKPPYNSFWFETENDLPLETYIKYHLKIAHDQFSCNLPKDTTKGIIVPHSEIRVSGICSATAYYQLAYRTTPIKRVILLCNSHHSSNLNPEDFNIYLPEYKYIQSFRNNKTPIQIDTKTINTLSTYLATNLRKKTKTNLKNDSGKQFYNNNIFENEHSFYTQLPFLEIIAPGAVICPIIIGSMMVSTPTNSYGIDLLNKFLAAVLAKSHTVIICTSDFTHYNINHLGIPNSIAQNIRKQDSDIMQFIYNKMTGVINKNRKIDLVDDFLFMSNTTAPGITALYIFSKLFNLLSINQNNSISYSNSTSSDSSDSSSQNQPKITSYYPRLASYYTSPIREQTNLSSPNLATELLQLPTNLSITRESKSYAGIIISRQPYITDYDHISLTGLLTSLLTQFEKHVLHEFLRELIRGTINPIGIAPIFSGAFRLNLGVWVKLQKSGMDLISIGELDPSDESENMIMTLRRLAGQIRAKLKEPGMPDIDKLDLRLGLFNRSMMITPVEYFSDKFNPNQDIIQIKNPFKSSRRSGNITSNAHILPLFFRGVQENKKQLLENLCLDVLGMDSRNCFRGNQTQLSYNAGLIF